VLSYYSSDGSNDVKIPRVTKIGTRSIDLQFKVAGFVETQTGRSSFCAEITDSVFELHVENA
jgi:hypothetical protein